jgi:hypothetical protein
LFCFVAFCISNTRERRHGQALYVALLLLQSEEAGESEAGRTQGLLKIPKGKTYDREKRLEERGTDT